MIMLMVCTACEPNHLNNTHYFTSVDNLLIIEDTINNEVVHFIVDGGTDVSLIDTKFYKKYSKRFIFLADVDSRIYSTSGLSEIRPAHIVKLRTPLGYCTFYDSNLSAVIQRANKFGYNVIGLIGSDFLKNDFVINHQTKQIIRCN